MATMYTTGRVTHGRDESTGRALCGKDVAGWLNLSGMSEWERIGFEAASNGPCANCSRKMQDARTATAATPTAQEITTVNTLNTIAKGAQGDAAAAPAPLPRVAFSDAEAIARVMMTGGGIARGRGIVLDWADVTDEMADMIRDGVFGSRCVRLSTLVSDASAPDPIGADTRAYLITLPRTPYVSVRATVTRGR